MLIEGIDDSLRRVIGALVRSSDDDITGVSPFVADTQPVISNFGFRYQFRQYIIGRNFDHAGIFPEFRGYPFEIEVFVDGLLGFAGEFLPDAFSRLIRFDIADVEQSIFVELPFAIYPSSISRKSAILLRISSTS